LIRNSPVKNVDDMATLRDQPKPNELAMDQKEEELKRLRKTLALNQRLMDTSNNLDALLNAYAGTKPVKDQKNKQLLFFQQQEGALTLDEDQKTAALKILNVTRKKAKGIATGLVEHLGQKGGQLSPIREDDEPEVREKKLKSMELIRKFAPEMPAVLATKI
jgi:hypothetical protein